MPPKGPEAPPGMMWRRRNGGPPKLVRRPPSKQKKRGYVPWTPAPGERPEEQLRIAQAVIAEYRAYLPLTVRQIYYRAVGAYGRPKTKSEYSALVDTLTNARRAQIIPFDVIRDGDDEFVPIGGDPDDPIAAFARTVARHIEGFSLDGQGGQPAFIEVHCEAAGMADQLRRVTYDFDVPVVPSGGQLSLSHKWQTAQRAIERAENGVPTYILHLGDADEHGFSITENAIDDPAAFAAAHGVPELAGERIALTAEQIEEHDLPPDPTGKPGYQLEALAPDVIGGILRDAILARWDEDAHQAVLDRRDEIREQLREQYGLG